MTKKILAVFACVAMTMIVVPVMAEDTGEQAGLERETRAPGPLASSLRSQANAVRGLGDPSRPVEVEIHTRGAGSDVAAQLEGLGATVEAATDGVFLARVASSSLDALALLESVEYIGPQPTPYPLGDISEGVATMETSTWTDDGATGQGQKVAIIDVGFTGYDDAIDSGDLPNNLVTQNYCGTFQGTVHGTGVAEIVHDVAPDAKLYLICIENTADLDDAVDFAVANGIDVINHSVGWWNTSRGDGSGRPLSPEGIAGRAVDEGIVWVQASGNHANRHWKGKFADTDDDGWHDFEPGDELNHLTVGSGETVVVYLKWDKWPTTSYDYDLYLTNASGSTALETSLTIQNGDDPPVEQLFYTNVSASPRDVAVLIDGLPAEGKNGKPRLDLFILSGQLEHRVKASSLVEPAGHPDVITVGATCWNNDNLASYSSRGPNIAGLAKPNLTAPTGVTTTAYGSAFGLCAGFTGTSSASPHAAGIAALILDTKPGLSPKKVMERMEAHVVDLGDNGYDDQYGAGRINVFGLCEGQVPNIVGTDGKDDLVGTSKNDVIHGYGGRDKAKGKGGQDLICGGPGADDLSGGKGGDDLLGQGGDDVLSGGTGPDLIDGGSGINTADYSSASGAVTVNLLKELAKGGAGKDTLRRIQAVIGSDFPDLLRGDGAANTFDGGKKGDDIQGRGGDDILLGKSGADLLDGGSGGDVIKGGSGSDHLVGGGGVDTGVGGDGHDTCETIENVSECEA